MLVSQILSTLTSSLEWMVLFDLKAIRQIANDATVLGMYHLPAELDLDSYSHVVLCNEGRFLADSQQPMLVEPISGYSWTEEKIEQSLAARFGDRLKLFNVDEAHCLGLGEMSPFAPVVLHLKIQSGVGQGQAIFTQAPTQKDYELLRAVGVTFLGGETKDDYYLARFQNRLPVHIHAGILSHFSRTAHCNIFFLRHGDIDATLKAGLLQAAEHRVNHGKKRSFQALAQLAEAGYERSLSMTCQPPLNNEAFAYGDLVPLGFVLKGLTQATTLSPENENETITATGERLSQYLLDRRQQELWAFHSDRLITSTDSALVLQGFNRPQSLEALEMFADGKGGYYPQLWSTSGQPQPHKMNLTQSNAHWCQADYGTTCLVRALRQEAGLTTKTSIEYLTEGISNRSGLYFANPYLVDWFLARAIAGDTSAAPLRSQLLAEILASINDDYSFGLYDRAFSTALAILTMAELGYRGQEMRVAQLKLLEFMGKDGLFPKATPFYSSLRLDSELEQKDISRLLMSQAFNFEDKPKQICKVKGKYYSISLYEDTHSMITTALAALALSEPYSPVSEHQYSSSEIHPRYLCSDSCQYIAQFALPPYLAKEIQLV